MSIDEKRILYLRLDQMIKMKMRGNAADLARQLGVSRSTFFRCLDDMRAMGAPIVYNDITHSYYYREEGGFAFGFIKALERNEMARAVGGRGYQFEFDTGVYDQVTTNSRLLYR